MAEVARAYPRLPSVDRVLSSGVGQGLVETYARAAVVEAVRTAIESLRAAIKGGEELGQGVADAEAVAAQAADLLAESSRPRTIHVINATGVVLHTNLGRALLARSAVDAVGAVATTASALEYDVASGRRGERDSIVEEHLCRLTGAEAATVVNNNAAAVLLMLNTLAEGREVVVSRGELIEIGGSFRIPDVMNKSAALLREVGTTNRTHAKDYEEAIGDATAMFLKVHTSNYRVVGFTAAVELAELRAISDAHAELGVVVAEDLGAGALIDLTRWGLPAEPVVAERIAAGADLVSFSGDKLLGGPQCGIVVGKRELVARLRRNPLKRALRLDKMTLAALEETLRIYRFDPSPESTLPTLRALVRPLEELEELGSRAADLLRDALGADYEISVEPAEAAAGSGSQPGVTIESRAVVVTSAKHAPDRIAAAFRAASPPIIGRIEKDRFLLDLRMIEQADQLVP